MTVHKYKYMCVNRENEKKILQNPSIRAEFSSSRRNPVFDKKEEDMFAWEKLWVWSLLSAQ